MAENEYKQLAFDLGLDNEIAVQENSTNYNGQSFHDPLSRVEVDGPVIFTERHRKEAQNLLASGSDNPGLLIELWEMSYQSPPSHQARFFLRALKKERGIILPNPHYDLLVSESYKQQSQGFTILAQALLDLTGARCDITPTIRDYLPVPDHLVRVNGANGIAA